MRPCQVSLRSAAFIIAILALNLTIARSGFRGGNADWTRFCYLLLPMIDTLIDRPLPDAWTGATDHQGKWIPGHRVSRHSHSIPRLYCLSRNVVLVDTRNRHVLATSVMKFAVQVVGYHTGLRAPIEFAFECIFPTVILCLPPLLAALFGGWLSHGLAHDRLFG